MKRQTFSLFLIFSLMGVMPGAIFAGGGPGDGGPAVEARLVNPAGVALDGRGNLYVADTGAHRIRKVDTRGFITTVVGVGQRGFSGDGGPATEAQIAAPHDMVFDSEGNLYFTDTYNHAIRKVDTNAVITTIAGTGKSGYSGDGGPATEAQLNTPQGIAIDREGNIVIADTFNHFIRRIDKGGIITLVAGSDPPGYEGDGGPAAKALMSVVSAVEIGPDGAIYLSDSGNSRIRKIDSSGVIHNVIGSGRAAGLFGAGYEGDSGPADKARIFSAADVAFGPDGTLYISDSGNNRIRMVVRKSSLTTIAGSGKPDFGGDGGKAIEAEINTPKKLVVDQGGNVYFADQPNHRIRKIDTSGVITTVAGSGKTTGFVYETDESDD